MSAPILATQLYIPPPRPGIVSRPRLVERLNECLKTGCRLTLISAPAGFGKTTLVSEWVAECGRRVAWLSLDEGDNNQGRFLTYLVAALQCAGYIAYPLGSERFTGIYSRLVNELLNHELTSDHIPCVGYIACPLSLV